MKVENLSRLIPAGTGLKLTIPVDLKHTAKFIADKMKLTQFGVSRINVDNLVPNKELFIIWDINIEGMMMMFEYHSGMKSEVDIIAVFFMNEIQNIIELNHVRTKDPSDYFDYSAIDVLTDLFMKCSMQRDVVQQSITNHFKD